MANKGIVMANGMVLKNGLNDFKADKNLVSESLSHVAKMSKGLYSGIMNDDPEFVKFQEESINNIIKKEVDKVCDKAVLNAEKQLHKLSNRMAANVGTNYIYSPRSGKEVIGIDLSTGEFIEKDKHLDAITMEALREEIGDSLASFNPEEIRKIKKNNKDIKKRSGIEKELLKIIDKKSNKVAVVNKSILPKKKTAKKNNKKGRKNV